MNRQKFPLLLLMPLILLTVLVLSSVVICGVQSLGVLPSLGLSKPTLQYFFDLAKGNTAASSGSLLSSAGLSLYIAFASSLLSVLAGVLLCWAITLCKKAGGILRQLLTVPLCCPT